MKLYLLHRPNADRDELRYVVVIASSMTDARKLTAQHAARVWHEEPSRWLSSKEISCVEIALDAPKVVLTESCEA